MGGRGLWAMLRLHYIIYLSDEVPRPLTLRLVHWFLTLNYWWLIQWRTDGVCTSVEVPTVGGASQLGAAAVYWDYSVLACGTYCWVSWIVCACGLYMSWSSPCSTSSCFKILDHSHCTWPLCTLHDIEDSWAECWCFTYCACVIITVINLVRA